MSDSVTTVLDHPSDSSISSDGNGADPRRSRRFRKSNGGNLLDSNGETDDEEIEKLHKRIQDQAKALTEEKQNSLKLKHMLKALKRENKQLQQSRAEKKEPLKEEGEGSGDNTPPWERRKSAAKLSEFQKTIDQKTAQVEQLQTDCENLQKENERCHNDVQLLTRQFEECSQQLQSAIQDISSLQAKNEDRVAALTEENKKLRFQLSDSLVQNEKNEQNLDRISDAVEFTVNRCKEIIISKERKIEELESKLQSYRSSDTSIKDEEIERLRAELMSAAEEMEENARFLQRFQSLSAMEPMDAKNAGDFKKTLEQIDQLKNQLQENELQLTERDHQVAELKRTVHRYESGTYGLTEATRELREAKEQLTIRDDHIADLIQQLNHLELRSGTESDNDKKPKQKMEAKEQRERQHEQILRLKENNIQLTTENKNLKRMLRKRVPTREPKLTTKADKNVATDEIVDTGHQKQQLEQNEKQEGPQKSRHEHENVQKEVLVLRQGLMEILQSVRQHDGRSDVKIESPVLERVVTVLNSERLFGHYDAYADIMNQNSCVQGENKVLREQLRQYRINNQKQSRNDQRQVSEKAVQSGPLCADSATDPVFDHLQPATNDVPVLREELVPTRTQEDERHNLIAQSGEDDLARQVDEYEKKLSDLELELGQVKLELEQVYDKCHSETSRWLQQQMEWNSQISQKDKQLEIMEKNLQMKNNAMEALTNALEENHNVELKADDQDLMDPEEDKIRMEKENVTLKIRLQHKEQTLKRFQQFVDEIRLEQLSMIDQHSREQLNLQETILEQQRTLHRVEQTQRELAASAASSQAVVRHLETEADSNQQLHILVTQLRHQMETLRLQATQWKTAADLLGREKDHLKQTMEEEQKLAVEELKNRLAISQNQLETSMEKVTRLEGQLIEERSGQQRCALLHVLLAKLKTELDKKEKQVEFIRQLALEMNARLETAKSQPPLPPRDSNTLEGEIQSADFESRCSDLQQTNDELRKQLNSSQNQMKSLQVKLEEEGALRVKLQNEKTVLREQLVVLRNRLTRATTEKAASSSDVGDDVCRLLKKIKQLEAELAVFHTAEKPNEEAQVKMQAMDQWKERKKLQSAIDGLKVKLKEQQDQIQEEERLKDNLRRTLNRLVNEKRALEDKLKLKAHDNERIHRLVEENTQWRIRFEQLELHVKELTSETVDTDRHRLQINVLRERIVKQEQQLAQLQLAKSSTAANIVDDVKLKEYVQRLVTLVQQTSSRPSPEKRVKIQEGPSISDIRRTVISLNQLVNKSNDEPSS